MTTHCHTGYPFILSRMVHGTEHAHWKNTQAIDTAQHGTFVYVHLMAGSHL